MARPNIAFFLGAGASVFMGLPDTKKLMESFFRENHSHIISPMVRDYGNKNIEDLYKDVNQLLDLNENMVLPHIPIICATNKIVEYIKNSENEDNNYPIHQQYCEHPILSINDYESYFEHIYYILDELKRLLGKHVFKSLNYNKSISDYSIILKMFREVVGGYTTNIITTNYDLLIEDACDNLNLHIVDGFSKIPSGRVQWTGSFNNNIANIKLLKLHGSLNWHKDQNGLPIRESSKIQYYQKHNLWIEPSPQKVGTDMEPFKSIRKEFERILNTCDLLIVIGFSFNDDIWKGMIEKKIRKVDNKMRLLYISKDNNIFINTYGSELIIKDDNVSYKDNIGGSKKQQKRHSVDYFLTEFNPEKINNIIKIINYVKQKTKPN